MVCEAAIGARLAPAQEIGFDAAPLVEIDDQNAPRRDRRDERLKSASRVSPAGRAGRRSD